MVEFIFTHDSVESALKTRDMLHECLKGCEGYINNDIILSDQAIDCPPGERLFKFKTKDGTEAEFKHCITLVICSKNENEYRQVIHVSDVSSGLFPILNGVSISIDELIGDKKEIKNITKWVNF